MVHVRFIFFFYLSSFLSLCFLFVLIMCVCIYVCAGQGEEKKRRIGERESGRERKKVYLIYGCVHVCVRHVDIYTQLPFSFPPENNFTFIIMNCDIINVPSAFIIPKIRL